VLFTTIVDAGLGVIGVRRVAQRPGELATVAFQIRVARSVLTLIAVPIMVAFALLATKSALSVGLVLLFAASILTVPWRQEWLFQATERMTEAAIAQLVRAGVFAALVFALVGGSEQLIVVGWAELIAAIAMTAYCLGYQHTRISAVRIIRFRLFSLEPGPTGSLRSISPVMARPMLPFSGLRRANGLSSGAKTVRSIQFPSARSAIFPAPAIMTATVNLTRRFSVRPATLADSRRLGLRRSERRRGNLDPPAMDCVRCPGAILLIGGSTRAICSSATQLTIRERCGLG